MKTLIAKRKITALHLGIWRMHAAGIDQILPCKYTIAGQYFLNFNVAGAVTSNANQ